MATIFDNNRPKKAEQKDAIQNFYNPLLTEFGMNKICFSSCLSLCCVKCHLCLSKLLKEPELSTWLVFLYFADLCVENLSECTSACRKFGRDAEGLTINRNMCPETSLCACACSEFNDQSCAVKCAEQGTIPDPEALDRVGCKTCDCKCPVFSEESCKLQCQKVNRLPIQRKINDKGCPMCDCACPMVDEHACAEVCIATRGNGSRPIIEVKNGCPVCNCTCPYFDKNTCDGFCRDNESYPILGTTDTNGCPLCECSCKILSRRICKRRCRQAGKVLGPTLMNKTGGGCATYNCQCEEPDCSEQCLGHPWVVLPGEGGGCDRCSCQCTERDCDTRCGGIGLGTEGSPDPLGCPTCGPCKPRPTRDPRFCSDCDTLCNFQKGNNKESETKHKTHDHVGMHGLKVYEHLLKDENDNFKYSGIWGQRGQDGCLVCLGCRKLCVDCRTDCEGITWKNIIPDGVNCQPSCGDCILKSEFLFSEFYSI